MMMTQWWTEMHYLQLLHASVVVTILNCTVINTFFILLVLQNLEHFHVSSTILTTEECCQSFKRQLLSLVVHLPHCRWELSHNRKQSTTVMLLTQNKQKRDTLLLVHSFELLIKSKIDFYLREGKRGLRKRYDSSFFMCQDIGNMADF